MSLVWVQRLKRLYYIYIYVIKNEIKVQKNIKAWKSQPAHFQVLKYLNLCQVLFWGLQHILTADINIYHQCPTHIKQDCSDSLFLSLSIFPSSRVLLSLSLVSGGCQRPPVKDRTNRPLTSTSKQTNKQHERRWVKCESPPCSRCGNPTAAVKRLIF